MAGMAMRSLMNKGWFQSWERMKKREMQLGFVPTLSFLVSCTCSQWFRLHSCTIPATII